MSTSTYHERNSDNLGDVHCKKHLQLDEKIPVFFWNFLESTCVFFSAYSHFLQEKKNPETNKTASETSDLMSSD